MTYVVKTADGQYVGRVSVGGPLERVSRAFAYVMTELDATEVAMKFEGATVEPTEAEVQGMTREALWAEVRPDVAAPDLSTEAAFTELLLDIWGNGFSDESAGDMSYGDGHAFRVNRWIVRTDSQGFTYLYEYGAELIAEDAMRNYEQAEEESEEVWTDEDVWRFAIGEESDSRGRSFGSDDSEPTREHCYAVDDMSWPTFGSIGGQR